MDQNKGIGPLLIVVVVLVLVGGGLKYHDEAYVQGFLGAEEKTEFAAFRETVRHLEAGDLVTLKYADNKGDVQEDTFVVQRTDESHFGRVTLTGPGPGSNARLHTWVLNVDNPHEARTYFRDASFVRRRDPGWETLATWFYLQ